MVTKEAIAIIPARGGSKRIPHKNIISFFDLPLIAYTIKAAIDSGIFDTVLVSTDSKEIGQVAKKYGAQVPFLRLQHADDISSVSQATLHALNQAESYYNCQFTTVTQLMPNCPLRSAQHVQQAHTQFNQTKATAQISCFEFGFMNPWWAFSLKNNTSTPLFADALTRRSQDLEKLYCPTGAVWISNSSELKKSKTFYSPNHTYFILPWEAAVDIDTYDDLRFAKAVYLSQEK